MSDQLVLERSDSVLIMRLNRPEARNALTGALVRQISTTLLDAEADPATRVLVITGTGDRAFCGGMDLADFADTGDDEFSDLDAMEGFRRLLDGDLALPVIGAANGSAVAGGFELLLGCDIIVASSEARFGLPEVKRGLFAIGGGTHLGQRLPLAIALELTLTGDYIDAQRAAQLGLVNKTVEPEHVMTSALEYAHRIAANGPLAVSATKELVRLGITDHARARVRISELKDTIFNSDDAKEGAIAFIEKRPPIGRGK
ncbi:MAG: enoyl-CoA hydratase-related protein [Ilumatobacteraceae bacterium]